MNLVYEPADRIMVLDQVRSILSQCTALASERCNCELCQKAMEVGRRVRYSPDVAKILIKGESMTTSEYKYLIKRGLDKKEISEVTGIPPENFPGGYAGVGLTPDVYKDLKELGWSDKKIGEKYGLSKTKMWEWKVANGLKEFDIKGLTKEKYIAYKEQGQFDSNIAKKYKVSNTAFKLWKNQNFTKEEQEQMKLPSGMKARKGA